nr:CDP-glycerol glycerophosphotransferase family protein [Lysinibacter cavernae]
MCVRRDSKRWVFGSGSGIGEGALELYRVVSEQLPDHSLVWLVSSDAQRAAAVRLGIPVAKRDSIRGLWLTLRAATSVVTHGFGDVNRYGVMGSYVVQLWHGIPLKRLHLDSPVTTGLASRMPGIAKSLIVRLYGRSTKAIALFPVASPLAAERIRSAFRLTDAQLAVTGDPRDDVLAVGQNPAAAEEARASARAQVASALGMTLSPAETLVLYAPTWRDGDPDPAIPTDDEWLALQALAERHALRLVIRSHPLGAGNYQRGLNPHGRVHLMGSDVLPHITPALLAFDGLITDYSSIAYDFSLVGGPIVWFAPDLASYEQSRGLYEPYRQVTEGAHASSWLGVCDQIDQVWGDPVARQLSVERTQRLAARHFSMHDGQNAERVFAEIMTRRVRSVLPNVSSTRRIDVHSSGAALQPQTVPWTVSSLDWESRDGNPILTVRGVVGTLGEPTRVALEGAQADRAAAIRVSGRDWSARIQLRAPSARGSILPPPSGEYHLVGLADTLPHGLSSSAGANSSTLVPLLWAAPAGVDALESLDARDEWVSVRSRPVAQAAVTVTVGPPLGSDELSEQEQSRREAAYRSASYAASNAVFFESFYGRVATCNPAAIDREIARQRPDIVRYWSVRDRSVEVPDGAVAIIEGSDEWWMARGTAKLLVVNDWLRKRWKPRPYQTVLQTWHGTMLKRLALQRKGVSARTALATLRESARWDILLTQNEHSTKTLKASYGFRGRVWQVGYPRNDELVTGDRAAARQTLGIDSSSKVVLYAPTWRDSSRELVDLVGVSDLSERLGEEWTVLVRGHSRTHEFGRYDGAAGVRDVSRYPEVDDLLLASDLVVTDYSSVMFDASVAQRPLVFYVPDLESYRGTERGFTFDFEAAAPGPLTRTLDELVDAVVAPERWQPAYASRYAAWRKRFNAHDDGRASQRVVDRLLRDGIL